MDGGGGFSLLVSVLAFGSFWLLVLVLPAIGIVLNSTLESVEHFPPY